MTDIELTQPAVTDEPVKPFDFNAALLELARTREQLEARNAVATQMRQRFYELFVQPYENEIAANNAKLAEMEAAIKAEARKAALELGDFHPHSNIEIKKAPAKWDYDDKEMLEVIQREGLTDLIRTKVELDKRKLNTVLNGVKYPYLPATLAELDVTVSIRPLGDLLIIAGMAKAE